MTAPVAVESLGAVLDHRAAETPDRVAFVYLGEASGAVSCTYAELRERAHTVAAHLRETTVQGDRVLLLYPPGLDFIYGFLGCASAGLIAVPAPAPNPLKPQRSLARLLSIAQSSQPIAALTSSGMLEAMRPAIAENELYSRLRWLATDALPARDAATELVGPDAIALIQYTSGSTADPKGAALSHGNVLHNVAYFDDGWEHTPESIVVNWLPAFHDMGLLYGILTPLWGGFRGVQMSPIDVIQKPLLWLQALSKYRATHSTGPNFIYELCSRKLTDADRKTLDLSSWRMALTAAEPIRAETMTRFAARFADVGFRWRTFSPGYGLSEGTCKVVAVPCSEDATVIHLRDAALEQGKVEIVQPGPGSRAVVACGRPSHGVGLGIVDPETRVPSPPDRIGEVWVSGPNVARSYWGQPEATEELLRARLAGDDSARYLRTGDLGFLLDGQLYVTGRIKDVIIVRGANHYPQDLEYTAQDACPGIRPGCCAAFPYEEDGEERVALVAEMDSRLASGSAEDIVATLRAAIAEAHGLRVQRVELIKAGTIPKTTSGKIQRLACKKAMLTGSLERVS